MRNPQHDYKNGLFEFPAKKPRIEKCNPGILYKAKRGARFYKELPNTPEKLQSISNKDTDAVPLFSAGPSQLYWWNTSENFSIDRLPREIIKKKIEPDTFILVKKAQTWEIYYFNQNAGIENINIQDKPDLKKLLKALPNEHSTEKNLDLYQKIELVLNNTITHHNIVQVSSENVINKSKENLNIIGILEQDTEVFASYPVLEAGEQMENPFYMKVSTFCRISKKIEGMSETGREIQHRQTGYIDAQSGSLEPIDKKEWTQDPLFQRLPCINDIQQSTYGDCFLLASLISLLNHEQGQNFILNMMKQDPETGRVVVRLFHPVTREPHFLELYSMYYNQHEIRHKALWVHIIEAAYASFGFSSKGKEINKNDGSFGAQYGNGGSPALAMKILTGINSELVPLKQVERTSALPLDAHYVNAAISVYKNLAKTDLEALKNFVINSDSKDAEIQNKIMTKFRTLYNQDEGEWPDFFKDDLCLIEAFRFLVKIHPEFGHPTADREKFNSFLELQSKHNNADILLEKQADETLYGMYRIYKSLDSNDSVMSKALYFQLLKHTSKKQNDKELSYFDYPSDRGYGHYSRQEIDIFSNIQDKLSTHILTASTHNIRKATWPNGLYPKHAYAITNATTEIINGRTLHFVYLHNPWGIKGVEYHWPKDLSKKCPPNEITSISQSGEFKLELRHFLEFMEDYTFARAELPVNVEMNFSETTQLELGNILDLKMDSTNTIAALLDLLFKGLRKINPVPINYNSQFVSKYQLAYNELRQILNTENFHSSKEVILTGKALEKLAIQIANFSCEGIDLLLMICNRSLGYIFSLNPEILTEDLSSIESPSMTVGLG